MGKGGGTQRGPSRAAESGAAPESRRSRAAPRYAAAEVSEILRGNYTDGTRPADLTRCRSGENGVFGTLSANFTKVGETNGQVLGVWIW